VVPSCGLVYIYSFNLATRRSIGGGVAKILFIAQPASFVQAIRSTLSTLGDCCLSCMASFNDGNARHAGCCCLIGLKNASMIQNSGGVR
jgi:hypothetical protein